MYFFVNCEGQITSQDGVHKPQQLKRKDSRTGDSNLRDPLTSLSPYRWATPAHVCEDKPGDLF